MDMTNSTAAGPSFGIFDVLFGNVPKEAAEPDGKDFGSVMKLLKGLEAEASESIKMAVDQDWTAKEIQPSTPIDYRGMMEGDLGQMKLKGMDTKALLLQEQEKEIAAQLNAEISADRLEAIKAELKERLPDLSDAELNRLVNQDSARMAQALAMLKAASEEKTSVVPKAPTESKPAPAANMLSALKQVKPEKMEMQADQQKLAKVDLPIPAHLHPTPMTPKQAPLKNAKQAVGMEIPAEQVSVQTAENWMSTDDFMQMQNSAKENSAKPVAAANGQNPLAAISAEAGKREFSGTGKEGSENSQEKPIKLDAKKLDLHSGHGFEAGLKHSLGVASKDVFLTSSNPQELRAGLTNEVVQQVRVQAGGGGGEMKLVLHPEGLGEIRLKVGEKNGQVDVQLVASNDEVAGMLKNASKDLSEALSDQKLSLAKFEVSVAADKTVVATSDSRSSGFEQSFQNQNSNHQSWLDQSTSDRENRQSDRGQGRSLYEDNLTGMNKQSGRQNIAARSASNRGNNIIDVVA